MGRSHDIPVMRLVNPPKKSAGAKAMDLCEERATRSGRRVPRSPNDPDISDAVRFWYRDVMRRLDRCIIAVMLFAILR